MIGVEFPFHHLAQAFVEAHRTPTDELVHRSMSDRVVYEALVVLTRLDVLTRRAGLTITGNEHLDDWSHRVAAGLAEIPPPAARRTAGSKTGDFEVLVRHLEVLRDYQ